MKKTVKMKKVKDNLNLNVSTASFETQNVLRANSRNKISSDNSHPLVPEQRLQNPKICYTRALKR